MILSGSAPAYPLVRRVSGTPSNYAAEGYRVLWTLCGVAIGVLVMFLAGLLAKRAPAAKQLVPAGQAG